MHRFFNLAGGDLRKGTYICFEKFRRACLCSNCQWFENLQKKGKKLVNLLTYLISLPRSESPLSRWPMFEIIFDQSQVFALTVGLLLSSKSTSGKIADLWSINVKDNKKANETLKYILIKFQSIFYKTVERII